jgi:type II secretory pathway pseudopilin PulG
MSALLIGAIVFAVVFGGALLGMGLGALLPKEQLSDQTKDAIKVAMAMIATLAALVLGLLTASAKSSLDDKEGQVRAWAAEVIILDRALATYGPEAQDARDSMKQVLTARVAQLWPGSGTGLSPAALRKGTSIEVVQREVLELQPQTDAQRWLKDTALKITQEMMEARWEGMQRLGRSIKWPFIAIVVFWLAVIFASFGLLAPRNAIVTGALLLAALSVAGALYLILEMDQPYAGLITISPEPLQIALAQLGKP